MPDLVDRVADILNRCGVVSGRDRMGVAVSGGLDSMVLLHVMHQISGRQANPCCVMHFNHRLRGRASLLDAEFVRQQAALLGLECVFGEGDVARQVRESRQSVEMAAREQRHRFLAREARRLGLKWVVLAHHADDQVELFFVRLLRGAGSAGLAGMALAGPSPMDCAVNLLRPFLETRRSELVSYATQHGLKWREDRSNQSIDPLRNRIRHRLIPVLERDYQSAVKSVVLRQMVLFGGEAEHLAAEARAWLDGKRRSDFGQLSEALQRVVLCLQLTDLGLCPDFQRVEWLRSREDAWLSISMQERLRRRIDGLLELGRVDVAEFTSDSLTLLTELGRGAASFAGRLIEWETEISGEPAGAGISRSLLVGKHRRGEAGGEELFDADAVGQRVLLRHWRRGDRFRPIGMPGYSKLQDLFVNAKVPRSERHSRIVAESETGMIFWVEGLRMGECFKLDKCSRRRLKWRWSVATIPSSQIQAG